MKKLIVFILAVSGLAFATLEDEADLTIEGETEVSYASPLNAAMNLQYTPGRFSAYQWSQTSRNTEIAPGARVGLEWIPMGKFEYGKPALGFETGFTQIRNTPIAELNNAKSHLTAVPLVTYLAYRADFFENQVLVPFGRIGLGATLLTQDTELPSGINTSHYTFYSFDYSVGLEFCMNILDRKSARSLDSSTGINGTYLLLEYLNSTSLTASNTQDASHSEFRLGLRFEI